MTPVTAMARSPSRAGTKLKLIGRPRASVVSTRGWLVPGTSIAALIGTGSSEPAGAARPLHRTAHPPAHDPRRWLPPGRGLFSARLGRRPDGRLRSHLRGEPGRKVDGLLLEEEFQTVLAELAPAAGSLVPAEGRGEVDGDVGVHHVGARSEERRVGKECRSPGS